MYDVHVGFACSTCCRVFDRNWKFFRVELLFFILLLELERELIIYGADYCKNIGEE